MTYTFTLNMLTTIMLLHYYIKIRIRCVNNSIFVSLSLVDCWANLDQIKSWFCNRNKYISSANSISKTRYLGRVLFKCCPNTDRQTTFSFCDCIGFLFADYVSLGLHPSLTVSEVLGGLCFIGAPSITHSVRSLGWFQV